METCNRFASNLLHAVAGKLRRLQTRSASVLMFKISRFLAAYVEDIPLSGGSGALMRASSRTRPERLDDDLLAVPQLDVLAHAI